MIAQIKDKVFILSGPVPDFIRSNNQFVDMSIYEYTKESLGIIFYKMIPIFGTNYPIFYKVNEPMFNHILVAFLKNRNLGYDVYESIITRYKLYDLLCIKHYSCTYDDGYTKLTKAEFDSMMDKEVKILYKTKSVPIEYLFCNENEIDSYNKVISINEFNFLKFDYRLAKQILNIHKEANDKC